MGFFETIAALGSNVVGGVVSNLLNQNQQENEATRNQSNFNIQMDETIQRRVADAKKAGLHPLYALGAQSSPSSQPIVMQDSIGPSLNQAGQNIQTAISRQQTPDEQMKSRLEMQLLKQNIAESDARANLLGAQTAQLNQSTNQGMGVQPEMAGSNAPEGQVPQNLANVGIIDMKPSPQVSSKQDHPSMVAGIGATQEERWLENSMPMIVPRLEGESLEEIWSEMSPAAFMGWLQFNQRKYGGNWLKDFTNLRYRGIRPSQSYLSVLETGPRRQNYKGFRDMDKQVEGMMEDPVGHVGGMAKQQTNKFLDQIINKLLPDSWQDKHKKGVRR